MRFFPEPLLTSTLEQLKEWLQRQFYAIAETLRNPDPEWDDVRVALSTAKTGASKPPGFEKFQDDGSSSTGVFTYMFDPTTEEEVFFEVQLPHGYKEYTDISPHIHWAPMTTGTGTVRWGLEYTVQNIHAGAFPTTTTIYGEDTADGVAKDHLLCHIGTGDIDGSTFKISTVLLCRLFRDASHANDTYTGDAAGISFDFHIQMDTRGSQSKTLKRIG